MGLQKNIILLVDCLICERRRARRKPKVLECQHGFCQECLTSTTSLVGDESVQCPVCWKKTTLTKRGITGLPDDRRVDSADAAVTSSAGAYPCSSCLSQGMLQSSTVFCKSCNFRLCGGCASKHNEKPIFADHVVVETLCEIHVREFTKYCLTCTAALCYECVVFDLHAGHELCEPEERKDKSKSLMLERQHLLQEEIDKVDRLRKATINKSLTEHKKKRAETEEKFESCLNSLRDQIKVLMESRAESFKSTVASVLDKRSEAFVNASNSLTEMKTMSGTGKTKDNLTERKVEMFNILDDLRNARRSTVPVPRLDENPFVIKEDTKQRQVTFICTLGEISSGVSNANPTTPTLKLNRKAVKK